MVFSSTIFLFFFLPLTLTWFVWSRDELRTPFLVVVSFVFYAFGEKALVLLLLASALFNWRLAIAIENSPLGSRRKRLVALAAAVNIGALAYFKYANFAIANFNDVRAMAGAAPVVVPPIHLPIGVSFVTFEALSYIVDVYRGDTRAAKNPLHVAFYLSFFPHLIAGPILRFRDILQPLARPSPTLNDFRYGVTRFVVGLSKKVLLANSLAFVADTAFALKPAELVPAMARLGIVAYALQIYFDFSGYSDMAVGLGKMFGFTLPENFATPYAAESIRDFWRRWHMTLSSWFRDYLFVPLGGSREGQLRTYRNLLVVFFFCGLWHGASWTFVLWGLFHGTFLVLERSPWGGLLSRAPRLLRHAYSLVVVLVGWVFFRSDTLSHALAFLKALTGFTVAVGPAASFYLSRRVTIALAVGIPLSVLPAARGLAQREPARGLAADVGTTAALAVLFCASVLDISSGAYNPFIYFRF